jgi:hypothetical protein
LLDSKAYQVKLDNADMYYQKKILGKILAAWKSQTNEFRETNFQVECRFQQKQRERRLDFLKRIQRHASESRLDRHYEDLAATFHLKHLMLRVIAEWSTYASGKAAKRQSQTEQIEAFRIIKKKLVIRSFFLKWTKRTDELLHEARSLRLAVEFSCCKQRLRFFACWRDYVKNCRQRKVLENKARCFLEMRLKTDFYYRWCSAFEREASLKEKNQSALIFWSISIQEKCLGAWIKWNQFKRQKKVCY